MNPHGTQPRHPMRRAEGRSPDRSAVAVAVLVTAVLFSGSVMTGCSAGYAGRYLSGEDFSFQDLSGEDFSGASLNSADFSGAELVGADLSDTDLVGADLDGADLSGADLSRANLSGADLSGANLSGVTWDSTICPNASVTSTGC